MMKSIRFDILARLVSTIGSRRQALRVLVGLCLGTSVAHTSDLSPAAAQGSDCRVATSRCRRDDQCCSQVCQKRRGRKRGKCTSLGTLAANCTPPPATCTDQNVLPRCQVNGTNGTCFPTADACQLLGLSAGTGADMIYGPDGKTYHLQVDKIKRVTSSKPPV